MRFAIGVTTLCFLVSCGYADGTADGDLYHGDDPALIEEEEEQFLPVPTDAVYEEPPRDEPAGGFVDLSSVESTSVIGRGTSDLEVVVEAAGGDRYLCPVYDCIEPARQPLPGNRSGCVNLLFCRPSATVP